MSSILWKTSTWWMVLGFFQLALNLIPAFGGHEPSVWLVVGQVWLVGGVLLAAIERNGEQDD